MQIQGFWISERHLTNLAWGLHGEVCGTCHFWDNDIKRVLIRVNSKELSHGVPHGSVFFQLLVNVFVFFFFSLLCVCPRLLYLRSK